MIAVSMLLWVIIYFSLEAQCRQVEPDLYGFLEMRAKRE